MRGKAVHPTGRTLGSRSRLVAASLVVVLPGMANGAAVGPAQAQTDAAPPPGVAPPIVVSGRQKCFRLPMRDGATAPHLASSFPAQGGTVRPGLLVLRVTFDKPMRCDWSPIWGRFTDPPLCNAKSVIQLLPKRVTFKVVCRTRPNERYNVYLNTAARQPLRSLEGVPLRPIVLSFFTSNEEPVRLVGEALRNDPHYTEELDGAAY